MHDVPPTEIHATPVGEKNVLGSLEVSSFMRILKISVYHRHTPLLFDCYPLVLDQYKAFFTILNTMIIHAPNSCTIHSCT